MYPALFLVAILYLYIVKEEKTRFFRYSVIGTVLVLFPLGVWALDKYFQGFYSGEALQWILPVSIVVALAVTDIYEKQTLSWKKYVTILFVCVVIFLSGAFAYGYCSDEEELNRTEIEEVYDLILAMEEDREINLVAPRELMENARAYDGRILTAYGRDIWELDLDYAFYGNYDEWAYRLSEYMDEPVEVNEDLIYEQLMQAGATHVVFDKENLTFDEDMHYPLMIKHGTMELKRVEETHHYVIYAERN